MTGLLPILTTGLTMALLAAGLTWWAMRLRSERDLAVLETERDLLRERVVDLEAAVTEDAQTAALLAPLREAVTRVERQVGVLERDRVSQYADLASTMREVQASTGELGRATQSLAGSLQSANVRGAWGEVQLRRILELAGMLERCDFDAQISAVTRDGADVRPDAVVRLPGERVLVIDAKAPMRAFLQAHAEEITAAEQVAHLAAHAQALRTHVRALAAKEYWTAFEATPELVVCFVPTEAMLATALAADPALYEEALRAKVVLASPSSLFTVVRAVSVAWQQDALSQNARELLALGQDLYARLSTLGTHVTSVGGSLTRSIEAYNRLVGTLESRVLVTARKFRDLDLVGDDLAVLAPVDSAPRPLTAVELLDAVADARPELTPELPGLAPAPESPRSARDVG